MTAGVKKKMRTTPRSAAAGTHSLNGDGLVAAGVGKSGQGGALQSNAKCHPSMPVPLNRGPCLPREGRPLQYIDVFVDDFLGLNQGKARGRRSRRILLHAIDSIIRPLSPEDNLH